MKVGNLETFNDAFWASCRLSVIGCKDTGGVVRRDHGGVIRRDLGGVVLRELGGRGEKDLCGKGSGQRVVAPMIPAKEIFAVLADIFT